MLLAGVMISLSAGILLAAALKAAVPDLTHQEEKFYTFLLSGLSFQGVSLFLTSRFLRAHEVRWAEFLGFEDPAWRRAAGIGLIMALAVLPVALLLNKASEMALNLLDHDAVLQPTMQVLQVAVSPVQRIIFGFTAIVLAPVVEEILFRGIAYKAIRDQGYPKVALICSSLLFGVIHFSLMTLIPLTFFAIVLAVLYERTGNLMASITAHSVFNAINFFMFLYLAR
jgi:uncharacterized protein